MPHYSLRSYQIYSFIKKIIPELYYLSKNQNYNFDLFFQKWILTLFCNYLTIDKLVVFLHFFIYDSWEALIKFSIILLKLMKDDLISLGSEEEYYKYVQKKDILDKYNSFDFYELYVNFDKDCQFSNLVTLDSLNEIKSEFYCNLTSDKIQNIKMNWNKYQLDSIQHFYKESNKIYDLTKERVKSLQKKIEIVSSTYNETMKLYGEYLFQSESTKIKLCRLIDEKIALKCVLDNNSKQKSNHQLADKINKFLNSDDFIDEVYLENNKKKGYFKTLKSYIFGKKSLGISSIFSYFSNSKPQVEDVIKTDNITTIKKIEEDNWTIRYNMIDKEIEELNTKYRNNVSISNHNLVY